MASSSVMVPTDSVYYRRRWLGLLFIGISVIVISLDNTILNVALPSITTDLSATTTDIQWIVDGYVLVFATLLLTTGTLGDRIGRKRTLQVGLVLFGLGSAFAAFSNSTGMLIGARMFLGVAGALMLPATLSIIAATFRAEERPQAIAMWASVFGLGVGIGPVLGGFLAQNFSWHAVFFINVPVVIVALIGGHYFLGETKEPNAPKLDILGAILSIIGIFALIYGIIEAGVLGWTDPSVMIALFAAVVFLTAFGFWEAYTPHPMLPLGFFKNRAFVGANLTLTLLSFGMFGSVFFMPQFFQSVIGYEPFVAGLLILPFAITMTFMTSRSARIAKYLGTKRTVTLGTGLAGTAFLYMALTYHADTQYFPVVLIGQLILAVGIALAMSPATTAVMSSVPVEKAGVGSAMNDTTRQLGGALGIAILGTISTNLYVAGVEPLQNLVDPVIFANIKASLPLAISQSTQSLLSPEVFAVVQETARLAFMEGMNRAYFIGSIAMFASALIAFIIIPDVIQSSRVKHTKNAEGEDVIDVIAPEEIAA